MNVLVTAGPTREPIDPVRYIGNRSSGRMGIALTEAALAAGHATALILGPVALRPPERARRIDVETSEQMRRAVLEEFSDCDLLIMAAAVADWRPRRIHADKLPRDGATIIECEPTADIVAEAGRIKRSDQRIVGFALETSDAEARAAAKLREKNLDLIVCNPIATMDSPEIQAVLLRPDGGREALPAQSKSDFARILLDRAARLF